MGDEINGEIENKREMALREYFHVFDAIDKFDARSLQIKSWSVTLSAASIGFAISQNAPALLFLASFSALIFWMIEILWKYYQDILIERGERIEHIIHSDLNGYTGPTINKAFKENLTWEKEKRALPDIFWYRNVMLPHLW